MTPKEISDLHTKGGLSFAEIGRKAGISRNAAQGKHYRHRTSRLRDATHLLFLDDVEAGMDWRIAATRHKINLKTAQNLVKEWERAA